MDEPHCESGARHHRAHRGPARSMRWFAFVAAGVVVMAFKFFVGIRTTHAEPADASAAVLARTEWLRLHPPRKARHDAELLRRRKLSAIAELNTSALTQHVPQLLASLENDDAQVRQLALLMMNRLDPQLLADQTSALAALLTSTDDRVRAYVLKQIVRLADMPTIASSGADIFECLSSSLPELRSDAVSALGMLDPQDFAAFSQAAVDVLTRLRDMALNKHAVERWTVQLESEACRERAGEGACQGALAVLRQLLQSSTEGSRPS